MRRRQAAINHTDDTNRRCSPPLPIERGGFEPPSLTSTTRVVDVDDTNRRSTHSPVYPTRRCRRSECLTNPVPSGFPENRNGDSTLCGVRARRPHAAVAHFGYGWHQAIHTHIDDTSRRCRRYESAMHPLVVVSRLSPWRIIPLVIVGDTKCSSWCEPRRGCVVADAERTSRRADPAQAGQSRAMK